MPLEARTHQIALHPTWDSVVRLTTCPLQTDSQQEPFQIQEMVSNLQPASSRTPNRSCVEIPPQQSYLSAQWPKELSHVTKLLTCVSACALSCGASLGIIAMFYFESLFKRKERAESLEVLPRL